MTHGIRNAGPASWAGAVAILAVGCSLTLAALDGRAFIKAQNGKAERADVQWQALADRHARQIEQDLRLREDAAVSGISALHATVDAQLTGFRSDLTRESSAYRGALLIAVGMLDRRIGQGLQISDAQLAGFRADVKPTLVNAAALEATYTALPDRLAYANRWLWDCHEFSGCLQSQTLALVGSTRYTLGRVAKASDAFPELVQGIGGMAADGHAWTRKYVMPHPMKVGDYFKAAGKATLGVGTAALRGGVF